MPRPTVYRIILGTSVLTLLVLLGTYIFGGFEGLSANGIGALIFGVAASLALGIGLMVALFASSRGYDEAAHYAAMDQFKKEEGESSDGDAEPTEKG